MLHWGDKRQPFLPGYMVLVPLFEIDWHSMGDVVISCQSPLFPKKFPSTHYSVDQPRSLNKITT